MKEKLTIRQETPDDFKEIFEINRIAFGQENEAKLITALRNNHAVFVPELSIVATKNDKVIGHILFTKILIKDNRGNMHGSLALAPMAVIPEFQKRGVGRRLIREGLEAARKSGFKSVIVLGHEHYYPKFGFEPAEKWGINAPFNVPSNAFMVIELVKDGLKNISGTVFYPKEFETV
ncbi:MAG: N-acetyltransferase [Crocinitomicaceae bacterium]|nr:N-acetyltransferase [Crocinitomicaceae bacterium]